MADWRYIVQRLWTGEILHMDLPLRRDELTFDLNGTGSLRGTLAPEIANLKAASDGKVLLDEWSTAIYAEREGEIEWGGIIVHSQHAGAAWSVEAAGFSTSLHGLIYDGVKVFPMGVDPLTVVRHLWDHAQAHAGGNLNMVVTGATDSGVGLGDPKLPAYRQVYVDGAWRAKSSVPASDIDQRTSSPLYTKISSSATSLRLKRMERFDELTPPYNVTIASEIITVHGRDGLTLTGLTRGVDDSTVTAHYSGTAVTYKGTPERIVLEVPAKPYTLAIYDSVDCGRVLDDLADKTPFDYVERHYWDGDTIAHRFELGYPLLGSQRDDLAFVQGDNITKVVEVDRDGDEYANEVIGLGRGDGADAVRAIVTRAGLGLPADGRVRRTRLSPDKSEGSPRALTYRITRELKTRLDIERVIESITVIDHPNAPIGSWNVGDDIRVRATLPWLGDVDMYCRIESWSLESETVASIRLTSRSSSPHARLARELAKLAARVAPLERSTQNVTYGSESEGATPITDGPSYSYDPPDIGDLPITPIDEAIDTLDGRLDNIELGGGVGGGGNMISAYYSSELSDWPARPSVTAPPAITVQWIGPGGGPGISPEGPALTGDLFLQT